MVKGSVESVKKKIFYIDIDNTIANYSKGLTEFVNKILRTNIDWTKGTNESERINLGLTDELYDAIKVCYRLGGEKLYLEPIEGARDFIDSIRGKFKVLIWTARPSCKHPIIKKFTKEWLDKYNIYYDDIIWAKDIEEKEGCEIYVIEDKRDTANDIANSGIVKTVFLKNWNYNRGETHSSVIRFDKFSEILNV